MLYLIKPKMHDNIENNSQVYSDTWIHKELELYINAVWYQHDIRICVASNGTSGSKCVIIWLICKSGQNEMHDHYGSMSHTYLHLHKNVYIQANNMSFVKCEVTNQSITSFLSLEIHTTLFCYVMESLCFQILIPFCTPHLLQKIV